MAILHHAALALIILLVCVSAAPSDVPNPVDETKVENEEPTLDNSPSLLDIKDKKNTAESQRKKRFYNNYNPFPPYSPVYPGYIKRDQASDLGVYGIDDPLSQIHRRLHEIAAVARQPPPRPPPPVQFPFFFPVVFVPQFSCDCSSNNIPTQPTTKPDISSPTDMPPVDGGTMSPDIFNRVPDIEDERQKWGVVVNRTEPDYDGEDFSRPISFDPIVLNTTKFRPAPPVEHGSSQGGAGRTEPGKTTVRPTGNDQPRPENNFPSPPRPEVVPTRYPAGSTETPREAPSTCDGAVLSCCHQPQVTYDCFAILGCPDPTPYGNPCDPLVILRVIGKYQNFYGVRNG